MNNNRKITPYHLSINLDSFNQISGYSYRNNDSLNKNYIEGFFIDSTESIYFKEYNLNTKESCPIYFNGLIKRLINNLYVIAGVYKSKLNNCSDGHINILNYDFQNSPDAFKKLSSEPVIMNEEDIEKNQKLILNETITKDIDYKIVKGNSSTELKWKNDSIYIKIFDHERVDGDKVKLMINNTVLSESLNLTNIPTIYAVKLKPGENILKIKALNNGFLSPNTSKIELYYNNQKEFFLNFLEIKQSLEYKIINN